MSVIYHLASAQDWARAEHTDVYVAASLEEEGFIHCSTAEQHAGSANKHYAGRDDLVLLLIDTERLRAEIRVENGYPHIYGPLDVDAVFELAPYEPGPDGHFDRHDESHGWDVFGTLDIDHVAARVTGAMKDYPRRWWLAGGWALDLSLGRRSRPHADIEISVLRADLPALAEHLRGVDARRVVGHGRLEPWNGAAFSGEWHQVWTRERATTDEAGWQAFASDPTHLDFLIEESEQDRWLYRRDRRVVLPLDEVIARTDDGVPHVRPEIALLFKAKATRRKDERDFRAVSPRLDEHARARLASMLAIAHPDHRWLEVLA